MKQYFILILSFCHFVNFNVNAENKLTTKANIDQVTIYLSGAKIKGSGNFNLPIGQSQLIFEGLGNSVDANSISATGKGNFTILDIQFQTKYKEAITKNTNQQQTTLNNQIRLLSDSIQELQFDIKNNNNKTIALQTEKGILLNNRIIKGDTKKDSLNLLKESLTYLREKLNNIDDELLKLEKQKWHLDNKSSVLNTRLYYLQNLLSNGENQDQSNSQPISQICVNINCTVASAATVYIEFFSHQAGWTPFYNIKAFSDNKLFLTHLANAYQNTGIDWKDASIILSTYNPSRNYNMPELQPYLLGYFRNIYKNKKEESTAYGATTFAPAPTTKDLDNNYSNDAEDAKKITDYINTTESILQTEYEITLKYSIPSDGKTHSIEIYNKELQANYDYKTIPKLSSDAYLMAKLSDWEDLNLLPGTAKLYFDNNYLGNSFIKTDNMEDTLQFNLGNDKSIISTRKFLKDKSKTNIINGEKVVIKTVEINIRNTKKFGVKLNMLDQIPISNDKNIAITLIDAGSATLDPSTGKLEWNFNIKSKETKKLNFTYEIKYPSNVALSLQ